VSITYRQVERGDIPALAHIRAAEWGGEEYWIDRITGYLDGPHNPQKALPSRVIYVAVEDNTLIGFIAGHLTERFNCDGELEWINVVSKQRGSSAASELFHLLVEWFVQHQAARICVNCAPDNERAFRFYTRHGAAPMNEHWLLWDDIGRHAPQKDVT
jgi:hypothetical protein